MGFKHLDVIGGLNLKKIFKNQALAIFVNPPSIEVLESRLRSRSTESEEKILIRMKKAKEEMGKAKSFDVILNNITLEKACLEAENIVKNFIEK